MSQTSFEFDSIQLAKLKTVLETAFEFIMGDNMVLIDKIKAMEA